MEIFLAKERAFQITPQIPFETARIRVEDKKTNLVAGMVGALFARPKPEEIRLLSTENRLEPFWHITIAARTHYDRQRVYTVPVSDGEVQQVTAFGQSVAVDPKGHKDKPGLVLNVVENCLNQRRVTRMFEGLSGQKKDYAKLVPLPNLEITDLTTFRPSGVLVIAPQVKATVVVRQVMSEVVQPVQAQVIHEERVEVEAMDLYFRPVYAFEYEWVGKNKKVVVEYDGLTGETDTGGQKLAEQFDHMKDMLTSDLLFDVTADAVGMLVPGGSIAVKLVKAVVDRSKE